MGFWSDLNVRGEDDVVGAPSILAADFARLADEVERAERGGASLVHFDVMDNHFVANLSAGPIVAASLARATELPIDAHLQIENPDSVVSKLASGGVASICVQPESATHLHRTLSFIRDCGAEAGVALAPTARPEILEWVAPLLDYVNVMSVNPGFGGQAFIPEMADKVRRVGELYGLPVMVDGGITVETSPLMVEAGARVLVAGSAVFDGDPSEEMEKIISAGRAALR